MKKLFILVFVIFISFFCKAQLEDMTLLSNVDVRYSFSYAFTYDHDLLAGGQKISVESLVIIEVDNEGSGRLVTYMGEDKAVYTIIVSSTNNEDTWTFLINNENDYTMVAKLYYFNSKVHSFVIFDFQGDNTGIGFCY